MDYLRDPLPFSFQIRLRTDLSGNLADVLNCNYLAEAQKGFAFLHEKPGNRHFHIYLFGLDKKADSIRKTLGHYHQKQNYSVKITAGKEKAPVTPLGAWQYGSEGTLTPYWSSGFSDEEQLWLKEQSSAYYELFGMKSSPMGVTLVERIDRVVIRPDHVWEHLKSQQDKYKDKSLAQIKSCISAEWLNKGKALPRPADLHRYSLSLLYLNKYKEDIPEDALISEYNYPRV